jgi:DNA polymerase (family 10)
MDSRTAAHVLTRIAALVELTGGNRFKAKAYEGAAQALRAIDTDDLEPLVRGGEIAELSGIGPATLSVIKELVETGESSYLARLDAEVPEGLLELLRVPTLGAQKIHLLHEALDIRSLDDLEAAARDGRLAKVKGFGPRGVEKILKGIERLRASGSSELLPAALVESARVLASVRSHPNVRRAELAGSVRRHVEVVRDIDIVAGCDSAPDLVAASFASAPGVRRATPRGTGRVVIAYVDGTCLDLHCVDDRDFVVALWRATGSETHVTQAIAHANGPLRLEGDSLLGVGGRRIEVGDEQALYSVLGLAYVPPELREGTVEVDAAARGTLPRLVTPDDIRGVLHCHSTYSDGRATIAEMADAARARGWSYIGITDHSQAAFYAGGLKTDEVLAQHDEIDLLNESFSGFRILKGIEADILADGRLDYDEEMLERFDFVIGSVHSRFAMSGPQMTERVLTALDDPRLTILAHPTGRLLLNREPYAIDMAAVIDKAAETGAAIELNADPHRLDIDWRYLHGAKEKGVTIEIGPDAHSTRGLDWVALGVGMARKGWIEAGDVLNARSADEVLDFARRRRAGHPRAASARS